ncbi:hypothetical protein CMI38_03445 [Candidatus Pacearchaeota archaeon]|jgi:antitoxin component of MazEF toxin-antitoxin module|nr:hypothetical protein [Candidatus Pacearchaeota archaeon]|tara:strand:+ start:407 stop:631 length:225 start_codon:yes stop_codon:yes gene_type:complete
MIEIKSKLRRWGNSFGIVVPQNAIEGEQIKEGDEITVHLKADKDNVLKEMFGSFKFSQPIDEMMREIDKELYDE